MTHMKGKLLLVLSVIMILIAGLIAYQVQTDFGKVSIKDIRFTGPGGTTLSALLYIPKTATPKTPAPAIQAIHGYINSRETQSGFAIEFARRGYVVLALDQTGHGYSDPPAYYHKMGGPAGLAYLRTFDFVDKNRIGLEGHSMGGWASVNAAFKAPNDYRSIVLEGSSTGTFLAPEGSPTFPKNLCLVFSKYDEFSNMMWDAPIPADIVKSDKLKGVFGVPENENVEVGKLYGSIQQGTARVLHQPSTTHPGDHLSTVAIGHAIDWFEKTLGAPNPIPTDHQTWYIKEFATLAGFIGCVLLMFAAGMLLLKTKTFQSLAGEPQNSKPATGFGWWIAAILTVIIGPLIYFKAVVFAEPNLPRTFLTPQPITNIILFWLTIVAVISLVLFVIWHIFNKKKGADAVSYGIRSAQGKTCRKIGLSLWFAFLVTFSGYLSLMVVSFIFTVDFRFWILALKPFSPLQFRIALGYLILFILFYLVFALVLHGQLRKSTGSLIKRMTISAILGSLGYLLLLMFIYIPLLSGSTIGFGLLPTTNHALFAIVALQLFPLFVLVSLISTYFHEKTGLIYPGAFINAMFITWYMVAGTATLYLFS